MPLGTSSCHDRYAIDNVDGHTKAIGRCVTLEWAWNGRQSHIHSDASSDDEFGTKRRHTYDPKYKRFRHVCLHSTHSSCLWI
jgi:hypothetical protein